MQTISNPEHPLQSEHFNFNFSSAGTEVRKDEVISPLIHGMCVGGSVGLWLWSLRDLSGCQEASSCVPWLPSGQGQAPDIGAFYDLTPAVLPSVPRARSHRWVCLPGSPRSSPSSALSPHCLRGPPHPSPRARPIQDAWNHKNSRASPVCWICAYLWIFIDSTIPWASAFWQLLYFFHIMIQYFMHRWLSPQLELSLLEVRHVYFIYLCIYCGTA